MEKNAEAIVAMQTAIEEPLNETMNDVGNDEARGQKKKKKKKRGAMHLLRVAMFMLRGHSGKSKAIDVGSKGSWKQVVGLMRPLHHLQNDQLPPPNIRGGGAPVPPSPTIEHYEEVFSSPFSPGASSSSSHSVDDNISRYASAMNLQELDRNEHSNNENEEIGGDETIDAKAEMFIAQFYKQAKLQRLQSIHRYNQMIQRSIE